MCVQCACSSGAGFKSLSRPGLDVHLAGCRSASIAQQRTQPGLRYPTASSSASPALVCTGAWVCTSASSGKALLQAPTVGFWVPLDARSYTKAPCCSEARSERGAGRQLWTHGRRNSSRCAAPPYAAMVPAVQQGGGQQPCCSVLSWVKCGPAQIMSVGGNGRARHFFKQHGWSELGSDKIEQKVCSRGNPCQGMTVIMLCEWIASRRCVRCMSPPPRLPACCCMGPQTRHQRLCRRWAHQILPRNTHLLDLAALSRCARAPDVGVRRAQYTSRAAQLYRQQLDKDAAKLTALPKPEALDTPPATPSAPPPSSVGFSAAAATLAAPPPAASTSAPSSEPG